jgi:hypothetical protein
VDCIVGGLPVSDVLRRGSTSAPIRLRKEQADVVSRRVIKPMIDTQCRGPIAI